MLGTTMTNEALAALILRNIHDAQALKEGRPIRKD